MAGNSCKMIHAKGDKKNSERCHHTLPYIGTFRKSGAKMKMQGTTAEEQDQNRIIKGN